MADDLPPLPHGFRRISGKRSPPRNGTRYFIQLRQGFTDMNNTYSAEQLNWIWQGHAGDVVAIKEQDQ
jgi:hypothetical protein